MALEHPIVVVDRVFRWRNRPPNSCAVTVRRLKIARRRGGLRRGYGPIFNAGAVYHDGAFHLFARGVREGYSLNTGPGPRFVDYVSDVLVFTSGDGIDYTFQQVLARGSATGSTATRTLAFKRFGAAAQITR